MTNLYGLPEPVVKKKRTSWKPALNLLQKESLGSFLLDQPLNGICKTPSQLYGVSPWEDCEQPLNRLHTDYEKASKITRPKSVSTKKQFTVSERLYKPWKYVPIKESDQNENSFRKATIDLDVIRNKQTQAFLMPLHLKYAGYKMQTSIKEKYKEASRHISARPQIGVKINKAKILSKTTMKFYSCKNHDYMHLPSHNVRIPKIMKSHATFMDTYYNPLGKIRLSDTLKNSELFSRLIRDKIRNIQRKNTKAEPNV